MKKLIKNVSLFTAALVLSGSFSSCRNTLYEPGDVGRYMTENPLWLEPFDKTFDAAKSDDYWIVEQGVWLKYHHEGIPVKDNNRVVLVLHGGPGIPEYGSWPGLAGLEDEYSVYYYHQRGSGVSDNPFTGFGEENPWRNMRRLEMTVGLTAQIADIERIRRILNIEKLILVGHSFGGFLAAMYASEFPDKVDKMVLVNPANVIVFPTKEKNIYESVRENLLKNSDVDTVSEYDAFIDEYLNYRNIVKKTDAELSVMNHQFSKYYISSGADKTRRNSPPVDIVGGWMVQAMYFSMGKKHDYSKALAEIQAETLLIEGIGDILKSDGWYEKQIPHITVEEMNTQHSPFLEKPEEFYNKIESFLNK